MALKLSSEPGQKVPQMPGDTAQALTPRACKVTLQSATQVGR